MEKLFKRILCPIDFDENSYFALDLARDLGQEHNATIYLLHVVSIAPVPAAGVPMEPYPVSEHDARARLEQIAHEHLEDKINYRIITRVGNPADSVNRAVDELQADSIVMATHGRKGIARLLLGSVAEKVVREASCPVLAVKAPAQSETVSPGAFGCSPVSPAPSLRRPFNLSQRGEDSGKNRSYFLTPGAAQQTMAKIFRKILCPIDFADNSLTVLEVACKLAQGQAATICLLHVVPVAPVIGKVPLEPYAVTGHDVKAELERSQRGRGQCPRQHSYDQGGAQGGKGSQVGRLHPARGFIRFLRTPDDPARGSQHREDHGQFQERYGRNQDADGQNGGSEESPGAGRGREERKVSSNRSASSRQRVTRYRNRIARLGLFSFYPQPRA